MLVCAKVITFNYCNTDSGQLAKFGVMSVAYFRLNRIELGPDNILYVYPEADEILNAEDMKEMMVLLQEKAESVPFRLMFVIKEHQFLLTKDARELLKNNHEAKESIIAHAAVFDSLSLQILFDLLIRLYRPPYPLKVFQRVEDAQEWLRTQ